MPVKITPSGWRWRIAQFVLRVLYNRKTHYICPWKGAGLAAGTVLHHDGKVLLGKRAGNIEASGKFSIVGGFMDIEKNETFAKAATREIWEEAGIQLDPAHFSDDNIHFIRLTHGRDFIEMANYSSLVVYFIYELTAEQIKEIYPKEETEFFIWADEKTCLDMIEDGRIPFEDTADVLRCFFNSRR